eukprot:14441506-Heterocapsa_arctica.AAC.1
MLHSSFSLGSVRSRLGDLVRLLLGRLQPSSTSAGPRVAAPPCRDVHARGFLGSFSQFLLQYFTAVP